MSARAHAAPPRFRTLPTPAFACPLERVAAAPPKVPKLLAAYLALGATLLLDRTDDQDEPLYVFADPAGHPLCIFVES